MKLGSIKRDELSELVKSLQEEHLRQLEGLKKTPGRRYGLTKKQIEDMAVGFQDGLISMRMALQNNHVIEVEET